LSYQLNARAGMTVRASEYTLDPSGRFLAVRVWSNGRPELNAIRILDLATGDERTLATHPKGGERCEKAGSAHEGIAVPVWLRDGRLVSDGDAGLRVWDLATGTSRLLRPCRKSPPDAFFLLAKLKSLTNLRAVRDPASDSGWKIEFGPFPGWATVPVWQP
jgi:hypothetical protein